MIGRHRTKPASGQIKPAELVHLPALRPDLREAFPLACAVSDAVLWGI